MQLCYVTKEAGAFALIPSRGKCLGSTFGKPKAVLSFAALVSPPWET